MSYSEDVQRLAARMPADLRTLRAKAMLELEFEFLGVDEVECPACGGTRWLNWQALLGCPVCKGFGEVPDRVADWFRVQMAAARAAVEVRDCRERRIRRLQEVMANS